jgi:2C-methyl-D-erythritol 2,4-cyclodiphosphate synthase
MDKLIEDLKVVRTMLRSGYIDYDQDPDVAVDAAINAMILAEAMRAEKAKEHGDDLNKFFDLQSEYFKSLAEIERLKAEVERLKEIEWMYNDLCK